MATQCRICSTRTDCKTCAKTIRKIDSLMKGGLSRADAERAERALRDKLGWSKKELKRVFGIAREADDET